MTQHDGETGAIPAEAGNNQDGGGAEGATPDNPPKWFTDWAAKTDANMADAFKRIGKLKDAVKGGPAASEPNKSQVTENQKADNGNALLALGMKLGGLSGKARELVVEQIEAGATTEQIQQTVSLVEQLGLDVKSDKPSPAASAAPKEPGIAATAATNQALGTWPTTVSELLKIKNDPKRKELYRSLMDNPAFDPRTLKKDK